VGRRTHKNKIIIQTKNEKGENVYTTKKYEKYAKCFGCVRVENEDPGMYRGDFALTRAQVQIRTRTRH